MVNDNSHVLLFAVTPDLLVHSMCSRLWQYIQQETCFMRLPRVITTLRCLIYGYIYLLIKVHQPIQKGMCWQIIWRLLLKQKLCNILPELPLCLGIHSWIAILVLGAVPIQNFTECKGKARRTEQAVRCGSRTMETRCHDLWGGFPFGKQ